MMGTSVGWDAMIAGTACCILYLAYDNLSNWSHVGNYKVFLDVQAGGSYAANL